VHAVLREAIRRQARKQAQRSVVIVDSQSVKTAQKGRSRGYDAAKKKKKVKGRKRHIAVDTLGSIWAVAVLSGGIQDRTGVCPLLLRLATVTHRIQVVFADAADRGSLLEWVRHMFH
jgi:hypothetical protein